MSRPEVEVLAARLPAGVRLAAIDPRGVRPDLLDTLERALVPSGDQGRRREFTAGRLGARRCLSALGLAPAPLLADHDGVPVWPPAVRGSISHKPGLCLVLAAGEEDVSGLGVDVEESGALPRPTWPLLLSVEELDCLPGSGGPLDPARSRLLLVAKEAWIKWRRSVGIATRAGFSDVDVDVAGDDLHFRAAEQVPVGRCVVGRTWTLAAVWTPGISHGRSLPSHQETARVNV
jgi:4'-phosphopantetheinyl transferase EntD